MYKKQNTRLTDESLRQAFETLFDKFNTDTNETQGMVESVLLHGAENAIPAERLVQMLGLNNCRDLRHIVSKERENGSLILSGNKGYYLPADGVDGKAELQRFERAMCARAIHSFRVTKAVRTELQMIDGQLTIDNERKGDNYGYTHTK